MVSSKSNSAVDRDVEKRLREHEVRYTRGRRAVVAALAEAGGPLSAAELHRVIEGSVPMSSIYRSLTVLEESEVVAPHHGARGITRYELAEWLSGHHHHLVCVECGQVDDVEVGDRHEQEVDRVVREISSVAAFAPLGHVLEIEGRCARCR